VDVHNEVPVLSAYAGLTVIAVSLGMWAVKLLHQNICQPFSPRCPITGHLVTRHCSNTPYQIDGAVYYNHLTASFPGQPG